MLKTQLHSKIFQVSPEWRDIEDVLTGDFFGTLDYLPRTIYLYDFVRNLFLLNPNVYAPSLEEVDWERVKILFWPRTYMNEQNVEPDVVFISNKWVLVVEVKLNSDLSFNQPWKEYTIGRKIAEDFGLSSGSVYYLLLAREHLDIKKTFGEDQTEQYNELLLKTFYLKWHESFSMLDFWLRGDIAGKRISAEQQRIICDLLHAMRRRRAITFSGFSFGNAGSVDSNAGDGIFFTNCFKGFLRNLKVNSVPDEHIFLKPEFAGFGKQFPEVFSKSSFAFLDDKFIGFIQTIPNVDLSKNYFFISRSFRVS